MGRYGRMGVQEMMGGGWECRGITEQLFGLFSISERRRAGVNDQFVTPGYPCTIGENW